MLTVFILCAGNGDRWSDYLGIPKQLITFGDERLIDRTYRLVSSHTESNLYCVTQDSRISLASSKSLIVCRTESIVETILATSHYWSDRNVFLLGDVFYSERALRVILDCSGRVMFFGRPWPSIFVKCGHGEMFGLTFDASVTGTMRSLLNSALSAETQTSVNLWNLYQLAGGLPLGSSRYLPEWLIPIDDYTNDIDTASDYLRRAWLYERIASSERLTIPFLFRTIALWPSHKLEFLRWRLSDFSATVRS